MISAKFLWGNILLGGKLQIDAKNLNFETLESALYVKSVTIPLKLLSSSISTFFHCAFFKLKLQNILGTGTFVKQSHKTGIKEALDMYNIILSMLFFRRALYKCSSLSPNFFPKKVGIFIPLEALTRVMTAC